VLSLVLASLLAQDAALAAGAQRPSAKDATLLALADRGAVVTVMGDVDQYKVLVDFRAGQLLRKWRQDRAYPPPLCGMGVEFTIDPPDVGPPMVDSDLTLLDRVHTLGSVDLSGTQVTSVGVAALKKRRPHVKVVWDGRPQ
jgi:hypothetical protein